MVSLLLWFGLLSSGSVLCAAVWRKKYEEVLPVTCSVIVVLLFLFGIGGALKAGAIFVCVLGILIYVFTGIYVYRKKCYKVFKESFFTPSFFIFFFILLAACWLNLGKMAENWDEFSHWMDIVKVMTAFDDYGTHPGTDSAYMSYPPGMTLFQYFLQKLYVWTSNSAFSEWRAYVAYQIFVFSFMLPCIKFHWKKPIPMIFSVIGMFLCPVLFYGDFYTSTYIDPVLGILSGTGFITIFLSKNKNLLYSLRVLLTCIMLVLLKDAGLLFAVLLAGAYIMDILWGYSCDGSKRKYFSIPVSLLAVLIPKFLWSFHLSVTNAVIKFSAFDAKVLWDIFWGLDDSYRRTVVKNFVEALVARGIKLGNTGIFLNYWALAVVILALICVIARYYKNRDGFYQRKGNILALGMGVQFCIYIAGLCAAYVSNFSEYEAVRLASFERYINIVYLSGWIILVFLALRILQEIEKIPYKQVFALVLIVIMLSPMNNIYGYLSRSTVERSIAVRTPYSALSSAIMDTVPEESKVYLVSQETDGFDYWVLRYSIRPNHANPSWEWSIGEPFYEGDIWTRSITWQEWQEELLWDYDYVALYKINDYFLQNFACLFQEPLAIEVNAVYRVNKKTGLLEKCEADG